MKIKKVTIENFRGIKLPVSLDFIKGSNPSSVIIYGRNGTGKSSIVDAWEWLHNFDIKILSKEGVSAKDYPHRLCNGDNSQIKIELNHATVHNVCVKFNKTRITTPTTTGEYTEFRQFSKYPNYLRYSDLQEFVYLTKTKKYEFIAKYFGLEKFSKNQSDIQGSITRVAQKLQLHKNALNQNIAKIKELISNPEIQESFILNHINSIAQKHKFDEISSINQVLTIKKQLEEIVNANPITKQITEWKAFQLRINQFFPLAKLKDELVILESLFSELKKDETNIANIVLTELYDLSIETLIKSNKTNICPICDKDFENDLIIYIKDKNKLLSEIKNNKTKFDEKKSKLINSIDIIINKITKIQSENSESVLSDTHFNNFFDYIEKIKTELFEISKILKSPIKDIQTLEVSNLNAVKNIDLLSNAEIITKKVITDKINTLSNDENTKNLANDYANLSQLINEYLDYLKNSEKVKYILTIHTNLELLLSQLTNYIQTKIQDTFTSIQSDVVDCYNFLEESNLFLKNPSIKLVTGKDKAVELEIEFVSEKITPAYKFMSESQVNSFGLAIFLASTKYFNNQFKFIILDDVINSFDAFKRPKVSQLIATKFNDFQFLILTHDQVFFDTVQRDFPNWQRYKFASWDYSTGPRYRLAKNYSEEIQEYLDEDKPITAGQTLGRYLEWTFGVVNENIQTPIRYKTENVYTLSEFYDPLVKRFKEKLKLTGKLHKLISAFEQFEQGTIFRNYCAHWKDESTPFTTQEIESIFKKWIEIENIMYCSNCKSFVRLDNSTNNEYIRCNCNAKNLKSNEYYE